MPRKATTSTDLSAEPRRPVRIKEQPRPEPAPRKAAKSRAKKLTTRRNRKMKRRKRKRKKVRSSRPVARNARQLRNSTVLGLRHRMRGLRGLKARSRLQRRNDP